MNTLAKNGKDFVFIINYKADCAYVEETAAVDPSELLFSFPALGNIPEDETSTAGPVEWYTEPPSREDYERRISLVKQREREGDSYLANLTCRIPVRTNLSLHDIFMRSKALYRCWLKDRFVCFSPEIFVRINGEGVVSSFPMKGTIDATRPEAEKELMENKKEAAEHATIVDLIRNAGETLSVCRPRDDEQGRNPPDEFGDYRAAFCRLPRAYRLPALPPAPCRFHHGCP